MADLVDQQEIAYRLGVPKGTVYSWHSRGLLGNPDDTTTHDPDSGRPLWQFAKVRRRPIVKKLLKQREHREYPSNQSP